jgi:predicted RNA-binding protein with PUA-like domain
MNYWLLKSEGGCYSIDDLKKDKKTSWTGIRNYQARNLMKEMKVGDLAFFYHSSGTAENPTGIYGICKIVAVAQPDLTQFDKKDEHYDPKATKAKPIWECVDVAFVEKFAEPVTLAQLKLNPNFAGLDVLRTGNRLSVQRVSEKHFNHVLNIGR